MAVSRRNFVKGVGGGLAVASFSTVFGLHEAAAAPAGSVRARGHDRQDSVQTIVNLAATAETLAITAYYYTAKDNPFRLPADELVYLKLALGAELYHLNILKGFGGASLTDKFFVPAKFLSDFAVNNNTFIQAETAFVGAYLAATRRFAELGEPRLATTTAQHACSEMEHLALNRDIGGLVPNPNALPAPIFYNVSDAVPVLGPFLQGGSGFIGPVEYPGEEAVRALIGDAKAVEVPPFTRVF